MTTLIKNIGGPFFAILIVLGIYSNQLIGQTTFTDNTISSFNSPAGIFSGDIDMDGDMDVVAGSGVNGISLWKNDGGDPINWAKQTIDNNTGICLSVAIADIIRDGMPDIVGISTDRNQLFYYKNEGGEPTSWSKNIIGSITDPHELLVIDFDQDGNQDVFVAGMSDSGEISWWHNDGGDPAQWTKQVISSDAPGARSISVSDIDGDGDMDVAGAIFAVDEVCWYRNDGGSPISWEKQLVTDSFDGSHRIQAVDMDGDGNVDLLGTAYMADEIAIWRNNGGSPLSWTKISVDNEFDGAVIGIAADINSNGHMDVFGTAQLSHTVAWYENKGSSDLSFKKRELDEFAGVWPAHIADIDSDLDIDLLAGGFDANEIRWWENQQIGRFNNQVNINGLPTNIGFFVPEEYNPEESYKMIVALHICVDENEYSRYRDNLIPLCLELNAILVSPFCQNTVNDLTVPEPEIILDAIDYAKARFNIDEDFVYLTGGSCNGRTTLKHGLDKIYDFRGIIPFNPYLPDLPDGYYDFSSDMPVCFGIGTDDPSSGLAREAYNHLMDAAGRAGFVSMPGVGHEFYIPEFTETMIECIRIIDSINENSTGMIQQNIFEDQFKIFPNPFRDNLNIQLPENFRGPIELRVFNLSGNEVYKQRFSAAETSGSRLQLFIPDRIEIKGSLLIQINNQDQLLCKKILKL